MPNQVVDHTACHRFELEIEGSEDPAVAHYRTEGDRVILTHTEVPYAFSGQGIATRLATGVFDLIRASGRKVVPRCPFMHAFAARHPEYGELISA